MINWLLAAFLGALVFTSLLMGHSSDPDTGRLGRRRVVAGCVPYRQEAGGSIQVCLINSRHPSRWLVFPKGGLEQGESKEKAAVRETFEEAGLRGILKEPLGLIGGYHWFLLEVAEECDDWPESSERQRVWIPLGVAMERTDLRPVARQIIQALADHTFS